MFYIFWKLIRLFQVFIPFGRQHVKNRFIGEIKTPSVGYYDRPELHADEFLSKKTTDLSLEESVKTIKLICLIIFYRNRLSYFGTD